MTVASPDEQLGCGLPVGSASRDQPPGRPAIPGDWLNVRVSKTSPASTDRLTYPGLVSMPPFDYEPRPGMWMGVSDVFHIKGRGTVITGQLEGNGLLKVGDLAACDGMRWQVRGIEMFGAKLTTAEPGANVGVLLRDGPPREVLHNRVVQFETDASATMGPQFSVVEPKKKRWRR